MTPELVTRKRLPASHDVLTAVVHDGYPGHFEVVLRDHPKYHEQLHRFFARELVSLLNHGGKEIPNAEA